MTGVDSVSYDIWLEADLGGPEPMEVGLWWNYTSNCGPMWREAGADLAEFHGRQAGDCGEALLCAIQTMEREPERFQAMNPSNGWGSYDTLLPALRELLEMFKRAPRATVKVSR